MLTVPPRLLRAVAESTQPYGPFLEGEALQTLQEYLADADCVDAVYAAVLDRASAEPISLAVIDKCVAVLKRYLSRFHASPAMLQRISLFCAQAAASLGDASPMLLKSLIYLHSTLAQLSGSEERVQLPRMARDGGSGLMTPSGRVAASRAHSMRSPQAQVLPSPSRRWGGGEGPPPASWGTQAVQAREEAAPGPPLLVLRERDAGWAVGEDLLHWRWPSAAGRRLDAEIGAALHLSYNLAALTGGSIASAAPHMVRAAQDVAVLQEHMQSVAAVQRVQLAQAGLYGTAADSKVRLRERPRLLFQYRAYSEQERLDMSQTDVAAVVGAVCAGDASNSPGQAAQGGLDIQIREQERQVCSGLLIKLLLDLYLQAGADLAYPLALSLLHRAACCTDFEARARAFDVIFNLSLHAELLYSDQSHLQAASSQEEISGPGVASVQTPDPAATDGRLLAVQQWLRMLLFELLQLVTQRNEQNEAVWRAGLGCLLHLASRAGRIKAGVMPELPMRVLAALLRCTERYQWSEHIMAHLVRLTVHLLYTPLRPPDVGESTGPVPGSSRSVQQPATLQQGRLEAFGGISEVLRLFKLAKSLESRSNWFCVVLDHALTLAAQASSDGANGGGGGEGVSREQVEEAGRALVQLELTETWHLLFQCAHPQAFQAVSDAVCSSFPFSQQDQAGELSPQATAMALLMTELQKLACPSALQLPPALQSAFQETHASVSSPPQPAEAEASGVQAQAGWAQLRLLLSTDSTHAAQLGQQWLFLLLVEASNQHLGALAGGGEDESVSPTSSASVEAERGDLEPSPLNPQPSTEPAVAAAPAPAGTASEVGLWRPASAAPLIMSTLFLAVEWLLEAAPTWRHAAVLDASLLLMSTQAFLSANAQGKGLAWDVRAALLMLLIGRCGMDNTSLQQAGGEGMFVDLLSDVDARVRFYASAFLQQRVVATRPEVYRKALRALLQQAQQHNDDRLLRNPFSQIRAMIDSRSVDFGL
ncbi:hypothetical protein WJX72_009687 [[Myrmecia] bisecta]|uniref:Uncharacterized protein n=1 Tax=[Myrmecia] bisecta TaxID=41462 RepID=A0AAW1PKS4_9CHLO